MMTFLDIVNKAINGLIYKDKYIKNKKFSEAINAINNSSCSFISKTAFAADIIEAFESIFLLSDNIQYTYDEIDKIIGEVNNLKYNCCVSLYVKDLYFNIVDTACNKTEDTFTLTLETINSINKYKKEFTNDILLNKDIASITFNSIKKISNLEIDLDNNINELNNVFKENCHKL